jgi:membrane fusion protein (multidrug efflux system)
MKGLLRLMKDPGKGTRGIGEMHGGIRDAKGSRAWAKKSIVWALLAMVALLNACKAEENTKALTSMPVKVEVTPVKEETLDRMLPSVGTLSSPQDTVVGPQITGKIVFLNVNQGKVAEKGGILARLDDSVQKAVVLAAQAALLNARQIYEKDAKAAGTGGVSEKQVESDESAVKQAEAQLEQAQANLQYTVIRAPFTGLLGMRQASLGAYLKEGDAIVSLRQLDPLYLDFDIPQQDVSEVKVAQTVRFTISGLTGTFEGKVTTVDSALASASRSTHVQATVSNPRRLLKPGMFAIVNLVVGSIQGALFVPMQSLVEEGQVRHVWIAGQDDKAELKKVQVGKYQNNWVHVVSGLAKSDRVITAGVQKLYPGAKLVITPYEPIHNPRLDLSNPEANQ